MSDPLMPQALSRHASVQSAAPATAPALTTSQQARNLSNQELQIISRQSGLLILRYDLATRTAERFYNAEEQFGLPTVETGLPESMIANGLIAEDCIELYRKTFADMHNGVPTGSAEGKMRTASGEFVWHHLDYSLVYDENGTPTHSIITFYDITAEREMQLAHDKWKSSFSALIAESLFCMEANLTKNSVAVQKGRSAYMRVGEAASNFDEFCRHGLECLVHPADRTTYQNFFDRKRLLGLFAVGVIEDSLLYRAKTNDPHGAWLRATVYMTQYPYADDVMAIIAYEDVDKQQRDMARLAMLASHDSLTGILNREGIVQTITARLAGMRHAELAALFMIDLDNFKQVNDIFGHASGDALLVQAAAALRDIFATNGVVGRLGGDEFMGCIFGPYTRQDLSLLAAKIVNSLQFYRGSEKHVCVSACVGIALHQQGEDFDTLYSQADKALYAAKNSGKCQYRFFTGNPDIEIAGSSVPQSGELGPLQLQSVMAHLGGGVALAKMSGEAWQDIEIVYVSPSFSQRLRYESEVSDAQKGQLLTFIVKDDLPGMLQAMRTTAATGQVSEYMYRLQMPGSGKLMWRFIQITAMPSGRDDYRLIIGFISDITNLMNKTLPGLPMCEG